MTRVRYLMVALGLLSMVGTGGQPGQARGQELTEWRDSEEAFMAGLMRGATEDRSVKLFLPLKLTEVQIDVIAGVIHANVRQTFVNDTTHTLEAVYAFPLPAGAAVTDMQLLIGNRLIRSVVQEKQEARQTYETARREGRRAALLEQHRPNIFTTSVANFQPGEIVEVSFSYTEPAEYVDASYWITFPMLVGPRYIPFNLTQEERDSLRLVLPATDDYGALPTGPATPPAPPCLPRGVDPEHRVHIEVNLRGLPVASLVSSTHALAVNTAPGNIHTVTLAEELVLPDGDFSLQVQLQPERQPSMTFLESKSEDGYSYGLLTLLPPTLDPEQATPRQPRDVIFLVDTSGSMSGDSIAQARAGLEHCLQMLAPEDCFTIVRFSDTFSSFSDELRGADTATLVQASGYVGALQADGGTEMQPALEHVLQLPGRDDALRLVVFLTDGCVGDENTLIRLLSRQLGNARLFTFGIGSAPNEFLMREMAQMGRGQTQFIRAQEDVGRVIANFFMTLDSPVLTDVSLAWRDLNGAVPDDILFYPNPCPDVFQARPIQIAARFPTGFQGRMAVSGTCADEEVSYPYDVNTDTRLAYPVIDKLFGRARIDALMTQRLQTDDEATREALKLEVTQTALRHQLVSQFTSRVAVEDVVVRQPDGSLVTVNTPAPPARGAGASGAAATATQDPALLGLGAALLMTGLFLRRWYGAE